MYKCATIIHITLCLFNHPAEMAILRIYGQHSPCQLISNIHLLVSFLSCCTGYVRTRMTDGEGLINADESVSGMLSVLEGNKPLNGHFYAFDGKEIPW